ncbi:hypothetical protein B0H65DRAFT_429122 [Neurospora tetraspora]|uniref:2EXR domain-containing protein n=1 Tax=Neurospora tetraspora TaxID=94610 RepID=A0AAE0JD44_9PEZI|nr:hypothetical protein B0H65DRAFT_429122 [Neurospora tetraspora]
MVTTFHLFPHLPWEIRSRIWVLTVEPREVEVRSKTQHTRLTDELAAKYNLRNLKDRFGIKVHNFYSSTPVPAPLQACREARSHLTRHGRQNSAHYTYRQVFRQTAPRAVPKLPPELWLEPKLRLKLGLDNEPRYIWVNFDVDMIDIGEGMFYAYEPYYLEIKRLKLARESHCELWHGRWYDGEIGWFANAEEIHVVCLEDSRRAIECWEDAHEEHGFPCDIDKLLLIDPKNGRRVTAAENDAAVKAERWARYRANGAFINPDTLQPFVPFLPEGWFEGQEDWDAYYWDEYYMNRS